MSHYLKATALVAGTSMLLCAMPGAYADTTHATIQAQVQVNAPEQGAVRASDLRSLAVYGTENEKLGSIDDLVIDPANGQIRYAVLSFGGWLGMGEKYFAVPWNDLKVVAKGTTSAGTQHDVYCTLDVSKQALKNAPGFDKSHWPDFADKTFTQDIERFYGANRTAAKIHGTNR